MRYYSKINENSLGTLLVITDRVKGRVRRNLGNNIIQVPINKLKDVEKLGHELKSDTYTALYLDASLEDTKLIDNYNKFLLKYAHVTIANSLQLK